MPEPAIPSAIEKLIDWTARKVYRRCARIDLVGLADLLKILDLKHAGIFGWVEAKKGYDETRDPPPVAFARPLVRKRMMVYARKIAKICALEEVKSEIRAAGKEPPDEESLMREQIMERINECLGLLEENDCIVVVGRRLNGLRLKDLAAQLGCSVECVRQREQRGLANLRKCLEARGFRSTRPKQE